MSATAAAVPMSITPIGSMKTIKRAPVAPKATTRSLKNDTDSLKRKQSAPSLRPAPKLRPTASVPALKSTTRMSTRKDKDTLQKSTAERPPPSTTPQPKLAALAPETPSRTKLRSSPVANKSTPTPTRTPAKNTQPKSKRTDRPSTRTDAPSTTKPTPTTHLDTKSNATAVDVVPPSHSTKKSHNSLSLLDQTISAPHSPDRDEILLATPPKPKKAKDLPPVPPIPPFQLSPISLIPSPTPTLSQRAVSHYDSLLLKAHAQIRDLEGTNNSLTSHIDQLELEIQVLRDDNEWAEIARSAVQLELDVRRQNDAILKYGESRRKKLCWSDHSVFHQEIQDLRKENQMLRETLDDEDSKRGAYADLQDRAHELSLQEERLAQERAKLRRLNIELQDAVVIVKRRNGVQLTREEEEWEKTLPPPLDKDLDLTAVMNRAMSFGEGDSTLCNASPLLSTPSTSSLLYDETSPSYRDDLFRRWSFPKGSAVISTRPREPRDLFWAGVEDDAMTTTSMDHMSQRSCSPTTLSAVTKRFKPVVQPRPTKLDFSHCLAGQDDMPPFGALFDGPGPSSASI